MSVLKRCNKHDIRFQYLADECTLCEAERMTVKEVIDTRDLQERIDELESDELSLDKEETKELNQLRVLRDEVGDEWQYGEMLIHEDYFVEYAQDLAVDIGVFDMPQDNVFAASVRRDISSEWPFNCIDWEKAADALKQDYSSGTLCGETYYFRSA